MNHNFPLEDVIWFSWDFFKKINYTKTSKMTCLPRCSTLIATFRKEEDFVKDIYIQLFLFFILLKAKYDDFCGL